ncbi:MAG: extracellular solute-binding protein [Chloroflexi bacterium]|nr:extracellular solute-binding protein [Chloroflexota bacterium]
MSDQFNWQIDGENDDATSSAVNPYRWAARSIWFLIVTAVITAIVLSSWKASRNRMTQSEEDAGEAVQHILDLEHDAFLRGDGDLFFSLHSPNSAWIPAQFWPVNMAAARAGFRVTRAEPHGDFVWANLSWDIGNQEVGNQEVGNQEVGSQEVGNQEVGSQTYQRIAFFQWQGDKLVHMSTAPGYWGGWQVSQQTWGELIFTEVDAEWAAPAADFVTEAVDEICRDGCVNGRLPLTLHLANDFKETAVPGQLRIPSPRLLALDEDGKPADIFWTMLRQRLEAYLTPATIRFAIPPPSIYNNQTIINYANAADRFMATHPDIVIELTLLETPPDNLAELAVEYDGAAIPPTVDMLAAGLVHDLSDYIHTDPEFDAIDFFPQIWLGAGWQDRTWMMPLGANMRVLYYDKAAYQHAELPEPSLRWTWDEMADDLDALIPAQPASSGIRWGYLDTGLDSLYSYAYNWNNHCEESATILCWNALETRNVAAALEWYAGMAGQQERMPDLTWQISEVFGTNIAALAEQMDNEERRQFMLWNLQTTNRRAAVWIDLPVEYERQLLLANLGAVPFPGSDRFDGITPLWVRGGFISQESERPLAVWQWLKFLSYQRPTPRLIPARPSVATEMGYWTYLPRPLGDAMRTAFPFSRPVTIEERDYITWEQVTAVLSGEDTPLQAAQKRSSVHWFE